MPETLIPASVPSPAEQAILIRYASSSTVITAATFKRMLILIPGRRVACVHRSCPAHDLPKGTEVFRPQRIVSVHSTFVIFSTVRAGVAKFYFDSPTKKNRLVIEEVKGGFVTVTGERLNTYLWLLDEQAAA